MSGSDFIMTGESNDLQGELDLVWRHLLPAMQDKPLVADETAHARARSKQLPRNFCPTRHALSSSKKV